MRGPGHSRAVRATALGVVGVIALAGVASGACSDPIISACVHHAGGGLYAAGDSLRIPGPHGGRRKTTSVITATTSRGTGCFGSPPT